MTYVEQLTLTEKSELDHAFIQERDSAAIEGFVIDEQSFRESWAKVTVNYRLQKEPHQGPVEASVAAALPKRPVVSKTKRKSPVAGKQKQKQKRRVA